MPTCWEAEWLKQRDARDAAHDKARADFVAAIEAADAVFAKYEEDMLRPEQKKFKEEREANFRRWEKETKDRALGVKRERNWYIKNGLY